MGKVESPFDEAKYRALLDGLEAVELSIKSLNSEFRIDSEYYRKDILSYEKNLSNYDYLDDLGTFKIGPFGSTVTKNRYIESSNISYIRGLDIGDFFLKNPDAKIDNSLYISLPQYHVYYEDIFITVVGTLGKVSIITDKNIKALFSCKSTIFRSKINPYFLTTFFNTDTGYKLLIRGKRGAIQEGLNLTDLKEIKIPKISNVFQLKIEELVKDAHQKLKQSKTLYKQAENLLLEELGLLDFQPTTQSVSIKSFSESFGSSGRLDSEYYQPKYDEIEKIIRNYMQITLIKNEFDHIKTKFDKSKEGYNYIEIGNVNVSDGTSTSNYVLTPDLPANAKINVLDGDLLISTVRPNRGAVTIVDTNGEDLIVSGAFTVLRKKEDSQISSQVLQVLLRTKIYKELLLKYNVGTQYPVIKDDDVLGLLVPIVDQEIQTKIEENIKTSFTLKEESKALLELAKRAVEVAIEEGEDVAMEMLNE